MPKAFRVFSSSFFPISIIIFIRVHPCSSASHKVF
jgi:hypothetical protein